MYIISIIKKHIFAYRLGYYLLNNIESIPDIEFPGFLSKTSKKIDEYCGIIHSICYASKGKRRGYLEFKNYEN